MINLTDYVTKIELAAKGTIYRQHARIEELLQKTQQLERENVALVGEVSNLKNKIACLEGGTRWLCTCGGTKLADLVDAERLERLEKALSFADVIETNTTDETKHYWCGNVALSKGDALVVIDVDVVDEFRA